MWRVETLPIQALLDHRDKGLLRGLARLQKAGEIAALPQLRDPQVQSAQTGIENALSIPVSPGRAFTAAFMPASTDQAFDIGLHQQLQNSIGNGTQGITLIVLCEKFGKVHIHLGHRGLRVVRG